MRRAPAPLPVLLVAAWAMAGAGCGGDCVRAEVRLGGVPTVVHVSAEADSGVEDLVVDVSCAGTSLGTWPLEADGSGRFLAVVRGLKARTTCTFQVATSDGACMGEAVEVTTGAVPPEVPDPDLLMDGSSQLGGYLATPLLSSIQYPVLLDADGDLAWWAVALGGEALTTRVRVSRDRSSILYNSYVWDHEDGGVHAEYDSLVVRADWDGNVVEEIPTPGGHHDFVELPDGTIAFLSSEYGDLDGAETYLDGIREVAPDGSERVAWSGWWDLEEVRRWSDPGTTQLSVANAILYDEAQDAWYLGLKDQCAVVRIGRSTGAVDWVLGGDDSDFRRLGGAEPYFCGQHGLQLVDGGLLLFDNGPESRAASRALEVALDEEAMTADTAWAYLADPPLYTYAMGDIHRLAGGNTLVVWGSQGQIDEVTPTGEVTRRVGLELGSGIGYVDHVEDLHAP